MRLIWFSPPCLAYSNISNVNVHNPKERYQTIPKFNLRQLGTSFGDEYIIENVRSCDDLYNPTLINGYGCGMPMDKTRKFETSFDVPDCHSEHRTKEYVTNRKMQRISAHSLTNAKKHEMVHLHNAPENCTVRELRSYIPAEYVHHILDYCPGKVTEFIDCFCSVGGVSNAVNQYDSDISLVGIDNLRQDKYEYDFVHGLVNSENIQKAVEKLV